MKMSNSTEHDSGIVGFITKPHQTVMVLNCYEYGTQNTWGHYNLESNQYKNSGQGLGFKRQLNFGKKSVITF
jgi:hypothetical protein